MRLKESVASNNSITFLVNGTKVTANNPDPQMSLNEFLRTRTQTRGVKLSCGEGGCGSCLVLLSAPAPGDPNSIIHWSVNSCLKPLCAVDGMAVTSAEGIGNTKTGFHAIQQKLAAANGSQCGFCTPGMCTQMFALLQNEPNPTQEQIEDNFDGNLCRCTGYRPILESMRSFAQPTTKQSSPCCDIEDLGCKDKNICSKTKAVDPEVDKFEEGMKKFFASYQPAKDKTLVDDDTGVMWLQPTTIPELFQFMQQYPEHKLIAGNTSIGIYKDELSSVMIELENIPDLCVNTSDKTGVTIGSAVPIANFIKTMQQILQNNKGYQTAAFPSMLAHLQRIASHPIRNTATVGGNLMVEQKHEDFPSDMFTVLATVDSIVTIATSATSTIQVPLYQINDIDMSNKVLVSIYIPFGQVNEYYQSYKVSLRKQNSHAIVNGGFKFTVVNQIIVKAVIVYAGAKHKNTRALKTEQLLLNQGLNRQTLQLALVSLAQEMSIEVTNRQAYRASLVQSLFYKYFLWLISQFSSLAPPLQSGSTTLVRPLSQATQVFPDGEVAEYPLSFPIEKLTAKTQGSGEAVYTEDIVPPLNTVFAAFVLSTKAKATILSVDISKAKQSPGFIDYISYSDVPGMNDVGEVVNDEPLFAQTETMYYGQAIGLVICDSTRHAHMASQLVVVNYQDSPTPPILSIQDAIQANSFYNGTDTNPFAFKVITRGDLNTGFSQAKHILEGEVYTGGQAAFYMEAQNCLVVPPSMGDETAAFMVYSSTQNLSDVQAKVCRVLNIPQQNVVVKVPLVGGAFGAKITRSNIVATAACVAANKLGVPVRCILDRNTDMTMLGNRHPFLAKYKVGFDDQGTIIALDLKVYSNAGCTYDVSLGVHLLAQLASDNAYFVPNWRSEAFACRTNMASNTSVRTFGTIQSIFIIENILEDVARYLNIDAYIVKQTNFYKVGQVTPYNQPITQDDYTLPVIWQNMLKAADYVNRVQQVKTFNSQNRWVKKGIAISPLKYGLAYAGVQAGAFINVYGDGTVIVNHSGCEIGQGINTKVAQAVAYKLQIPLTSINVNVTATDKVPFSTGTGGSIASECCVAAANIACEELLARVASFKGQTWADTIGNALGNGVNLSVTALSYSGNMEMQQLAGFAKRNVRLPKGPDGQTLTVFVGTDKVKDNTPGPFAYNTFAACCTEVELDVLTGEYQILRADIQFDCGVSMNPLIDIGQIEGGFVMGLGNFLTEEMLYNDDGSVITNGTWEYKIPCSFTIPIEFNVNLLPNASNPNGIYNSKAVGEPPMTLSASVVFALKHAISAARQDGGNSGNFRLDTPVTIEKAQQTCSTSSQQYYI